MSNLTRRAILRGSAAAAAAAAVSSVPAIAAIPAPGMASSGLAALAARAVKLHRADQADWLAYRCLMQEKATPDLLPLVRGDWDGITDDLRQRYSALSRECSTELGRTDEDDDDEEPTEGELISRAMVSTPASTVADVLAKLRWVMGQLDPAILSEAPKLTEAYEWSGAPRTK